MDWTPCGNAPCPEQDNDHAADAQAEEGFEHRVARLDAEAEGSSLREHFLPRRTNNI